MFNNDLYEQLQENDIILNINLYEPFVLEIDRISQCLNNNKLIVSYESSDKKLNKKYEKYIIFVNS